MSKNKKPTMMQVKNVINNVLMELQQIKGAISNLDFITNYYIKYNKDEDKFKEFLEKQTKKLEKEAKKLSIKTDVNESKGEYGSYEEKSSK